MIKKIWNSQLQNDSPSPFVKQVILLLEEFSDLHDGKSPYTLNELITTEQVEQFELKTKVDLPVDYRDFLIHIGNGGTLHRPFPVALSHASDALRSCLQSEAVNETYIGLPFEPYKCKLCFDDSLDEIDDDMEDYEYDKMLLEAFHGTITLYNDGCGYYDLLVVAGEQKGKVYAIDTCSGQGIREIADSFEAYFMKFIKYEIEERRAHIEHNDKFECFIKEVIPGGNVRELIVTTKEKEKNIQFEYFAPQEFLREGETSKLNQVNDAITVSLFMEDKSYSCVIITPLLANSLTSALEEANTSSDFLLVGERSEHVIIGRINRRFEYGRLQSRSLPLYIESLQQEILIIADDKIDYQVGEWLKVKGRLNGEIY
ncbi:SMI1/KNR4 family protein [Paenibacillus turicensis]|uniref:SMI1/KNR4 family protein n=1 Tax=Paenibacillus turicensis TaxID=160487 RepID=UPI003D270E65